MADLSLAFDVLGRDKGASKVFKDTADASDGLFSKLKGLGGFLAGGAIVAGAVQAGKSIVGVFSDAVSEAREAAQIGRITENAIKATGGAAGVTADQVGDLAGRLSNLTAVDDELVQQGANLILTFKNIRNEAGKGNDIFNQATAAALDLSAAGFGSVESASIQLGKALNDPLKGIAALGKSGVTFTDQQKEQIKTLVESGKVLDAQKIILGEINAQVGGAAKAAADPMARLQVVTGNLKEELGARLLPIVEKAGTFLADNLPRAMDIAGEGFKRVAKFVEPVTELVGKLWDTFTGRGDKGAGVVVDIATMFGIQEDDPRLEQFFTAMETVEDVIGRIVTFVQDYAKPILIGLGVTFAALVSPVAVAVGALVLLYTRFEIVRDIVGAVISFVQDRFQRIAAFAQEIWPQVSEAVGHAIEFVRDIITTTLDRLQLAWSIWGDDIMRVVSGVFGVIQGIVEVGVETIKTVIRVVLAVINGDWGKAWDALKAAPAQLIEGVKKILGGLLDVVSGILGGVVDGAGEIVGDFFDLGVDLVSGFIRGIKSMAGKLISAIKEAITDKLPGFVKSALGIASPSKVMMRLGAQAAEGFALGVGDLGDSLRLSAPSIDPVFMPGVQAASAAPNVQVFIGDREITEIVRVEVRDRDQRLVGALRGGAGRVG